MEHLESITLYPSAYAKKQLIKKAWLPLLLSDNERWAEGTNVKLHLIFLLNCTPLLHVIHAVAVSIPHCENVLKKFKNVTLSIIAYERSNALPACFSDIQKLIKDQIFFCFYLFLNKDTIPYSMCRGALVHTPFTHSLAD